jgi:hypothetical protein
MKILDIPKSGKCGQVVAFRSRFGLCLRQLVVPRNKVTSARQFMRGAFGRHSHAFSHQLTQQQQDRWNLAGGQVMSDPRLGDSGPLSGQQLCTSINSVLSRVGAPAVADPPAPVTFGPSPVGQLVIENNEAGVRLLLRVPGELNEDVMVFGQEPCSAGRSKRRNVCYLGLLPPPIGGFSDITHLYKARFGEPRPRHRVFLVTCQQQNGWKALDHETNAVVPEPPKAQQAPAAIETSQNLHMHKGSTRDAQGIVPPEHSQALAGAETETGAETRISPINPEEGGGRGGGPSPG